MDLVKAWVVAVVTYLLGSLLFGFVAASAGNPEQLNSGLSHYLWSLVPAFVLYFLTASLAAIFHGRGSGTTRHVLAVLAVPVAALLISIVGGLASGQVAAADTALSALVAIVGTIAGWQLVDRLRSEKAYTETYW